MDQIIQGISLGLVLSILAGPIFLSLVTLGIERGLRAGTVFAAGQWTSDLIFIGTTYWGMFAMAQNPHFKHVVGVAGGIMLIVFGLFMLATKPRLDMSQPQEITARNYTGFFVRGFLMNTVNPFPVFFWMSVASDGFQSGKTTVEFAVLYGALMGTIMSTDVLKVYLAKKIRRFMKPHYLIRMRRVAGIGLIVFGIVLMIRVW